ncbi:MAG: hypothetical protein DLM61_24590 [Pseudonocardiales bacterium]|nr:MAG: hypothetical protein DLM61_24590 [Pseudonocardiales bacterium]
MTAVRVGPGTVAAPVSLLLLLAMGTKSIPLAVLDELLLHIVTTIKRCAMSKLVTCGVDLALR